MAFGKLGAMGRGFGTLGVLGTVNLPLPSLPLPNGARVFVQGDSLVAQNNAVVNVADVGVSTTAYGPMSQALNLDPRFNFDSWYDASDIYNRNWQGANQGISGDHIGPWDSVANGIVGNGVLPRMDYTVSRRVQLLWAQGISNTLASGDVSGSSTGASSSYCIAQYDALLRRARRAGIWVVLETVRPRSDYDATRETNRLAVNVWIRAQSGREGVAAICDVEPLLLPGGVQDTSLYIQEAGNYVHANQKGAYLLGRDYYLPILQSLIAPGAVFNTSPIVSSLLATTVGQLQGTGGLKPGGTGSVADSCYVKRRRGTSTFVCSKETISSGYFKQVVTLTPVADATAVHQFDIGLPFITTGLPAAGTWIRGYAYVEVGATEAIPLTILNLAVNDSTTGSGSITDGGVGTDRAVGRGDQASFSSSLYGYLPGVASRAKWIMTDPIFIPNGASFDRIGMFVQFFLDQRTSDTGIVIKMRDPIIRTVADPRTALGF